MDTTKAQQQRCMLFARRLRRKLAPPGSTLGISLGRIICNDENEP